MGVWMGGMKGWREGNGGLSRRYGGFEGKVQLVEGVVAADGEDEGRGDALRTCGMVSSEESLVASWPPQTNSH
eukprot:2827748-Rhodomonas_salina.2